MVKTLFLPASLDGLSPLSASIRFRAAWPAKYMPNADFYDGTQRLRDYEAFVFQKLYLTSKAVQWARSLSQAGKIMAFDLCDADWLSSETHQDRLLRLLPLFHFAVAPTSLLAGWLSNWLPTHVIPDRVDLEVHAERHEPRDTDSPRLVWLGNSGNLVTLGQMWPTIRDMKLELTILADKLVAPWDELPVRFVAWTLEGANAEIARHDVALNPRLECGHFAYKSMNKTITAWALGVPVAHTPDELGQLLHFKARVKESRRRLREVTEKWDVHISARAWENLLDIWQEKLRGGDESTFWREK